MRPCIRAYVPATHKSQVRDREIADTEPGEQGVHDRTSCKSENVPAGQCVHSASSAGATGSVYGATDELGYRAVEDVCDVYDMWATVLHLMGLDHESLTYRYGGRDVRLTDVHGDVIRGAIS